MRGGASRGWRGGLRRLYVGPGKLVSDDARRRKHPCERKRHRGAGAARPGAGVACVLDGHGCVRGTRLGADGDAQHGGSPFGVAVTPDGRYGFAAVPGGGTGGSVIDVLRMATTASGRPVLVRSIPVADQPLGETITPDGRYLLAADGNGAVVISVARAGSGAAGAVLGTLAAVDTAIIP